MAWRILRLEEQRDEDREGFSEAQTEKLDKKFPSREAFSLVQRIVFGMTSIALTGVFGAIVAYVLHKSSGG